MLILTRYPNEQVEIICQGTANITITVMDVMSNGVVKLGFDAPDHVRFLRDNAIRRRPRTNATEMEVPDEQKDNEGNR